MNAHDVETIVKLFKASGWRELHVRVDGGELFLSMDPAARMGASTAQPNIAVAAASANKSAPPPAPGAIPSDIPSNWVVVAAPNLGTFYRAAKPGMPPMVEIGQQVSASTEVCLLEVMKLFTAVTAAVAGKIVQVCAEDAELVEGGRILFYIEKA